MPLRAALVGYGYAGKLFHAALIDATPGLHLQVIGSNRPDAVRADRPNVVVCTPDAAATQQICGTAGTIKLALKKGGTKPSKPFKVSAKAVSTASGALKTDADKLILRCLPPAPGCPENTAGGPNEFKFIIQREATDLDNGWTGASHSQPMVFGTTSLERLPHPPAALPVFVHLALGLMLGLWIPGYLDAWYREAARMIGG